MSEGRMGILFVDIIYHISYMGSISYAALPPWAQWYFWGVGLLFQRYACMYVCVCVCGCFSVLSITDPSGSSIIEMRKINSNTHTHTQHT